MSDDQKIITPDTRLKALALFTIAHDHYRKCREYEAALFDVLGYDDSDGRPYMGHLSDEIYQDIGGDFERGLRLENFVVEPQS